MDRDDVCICGHTRGTHIARGEPGACRGEQCRCTEFGLATPVGTITVQAQVRRKREEAAARARRADRLFKEIRFAASNPTAIKRALQRLIENIK